MHLQHIAALSAQGILFETNTHYRRNMPTSSSLTRCTSSQPRALGIVLSTNHESCTSSLVQSMGSLSCPIVVAPSHSFYEPV